MKIKAVKVKETCFKKDHPYIMDLTFSKYDFEKKGEQITGYSISETNKNALGYYIYREMGLSESSLNTITKPFSLLSHCKVSCDSPCCTKLFGDKDNHCKCNIDSHEHVNTDSDEEQIDKQ